MRKNIILTLMIMVFMTTFLYACENGNTNSIEKTIGASDIYSNEEIESAMEVVTNFFDKEFKGSTLTELSYDESISSALSDEWAKQYDAEEAIVLVSSFDVDKTGGDGSLNPNSSYDNWQWILTRSNNEKWTLQTWGY